ncbi:hypothetical protein AAVH_22104, partial [Aphelenchoides avenae]
MGAGNSKKPHAIYVSNGSAYVIDVNCDTDRIYVQQQSGKLATTFGNVSASVDNARTGMLYYTATSTGATRVAPGKSLYFTPNCSKDKTVYATIVQEQEGENKRSLCVDFPMKVDQALIVGYDGTIHFAANTNKGKEKEAKSSARKGQKSTDPDNETPAPPCDGKIEEEGTVIEPTHDASLWVDTNGFDHFLNRSRIYDYVSAHVANGSEQTIWVKCDTNRDYVLEESVKLSDEIEKERERGRTKATYTNLYVFAKSRGFVKITGREAFPFKPPQKHGATVFIAIYQEQEDGFLKLNDNFPAEANENVIVGYDGVIHRAETGKVWTDTDGKNHRKT